MSKCLVIEVLTYLVLVDANDDVIVPVLASPLPRIKWKLRSTDLSLFSNLPTYFRKRDWGGDPSEAVRVINSIHWILKFWSVDVATYQVADYDDDDADC